MESYIIDTVDELQFSWFDKKEYIGITSGASVPKKIVDDVVNAIKNRFGVDIPVYQGANIETGINFPLPNI